MRRSRKWIGFWLPAIIGLAVVFQGPASPAAAWEFELEASLAWNWYSAWQAGPQGFFGPWDVDAAGQNLQNQNFWAGANKWDGVFPSKHVSVNTQFMEFSPEFTINKAVRIRGNYYIGARDDVNLDPAASEYTNSSAPGTLVAMSPGYWNQLWGSAQTPWGILVAGKRPFTFGIGGIASGEDCTTTESLALISSYGPMRYGLVIYPARRMSDASVPALNTDMEWASEGEAAVQDENGALLRDPHLAGFLTYEAGPMEFGALWEYIRWGVGPDGLISQGLTAAERADARNNFIPYDFHVNNTIFYMKYQNGRFFFNAEADIMESMTRRRPPAGGTYKGATSVDNVAGAGSLWQTGHVLAKRFYVETGAYAGPSKITGLLGWIDGYDRRHGVLIDKQGTSLWLAPPRAGQARTTYGLANWFDAAPNGIIFYPYSYLLVFNYGGGNNHFNVQGDGYLVDAVAYAARVDYAVASNLNVWGSFFYANRLGKGYGWGFISPDGEGNVGYERLGAHNDPAPAIPDDNLGWEIGAGVDWQLLEGLIFASRFAYWQPGEWFNFACRSKSNANWNAPASGNNWGTTPNRTIDPVMGLEVVLGWEF